MGPKKICAQLLTLSAFSLFALVGILAPSRTALAFPADIKWAQIETSHFIVLYDSKHRELGQQYATFAEEAFASVAPVFGQWPEKTVIVLDDTTDLANGSATGVPFPLIEAYPVLPTAHDSIGDYGDWGLELLTHEFTHILNFEPVSGWLKPFRYVFGSVVRPNILLPRWYSEGLAVEMETRLSSFGRLRSSNYLAIVRALKENDALWREDISRINEVSIPDWPGGARPYLLGALMWNEMIAQKGLPIVRQLNEAYSHRVPFLIEGPPKSLLGSRYPEILDQAYSRAEAIIAKQVKTINTGHKVDEILLAQKSIYSREPVVSPDGKKLAYIGRQHDADSLIYVLDRPADGSSFNPKEPPKSVGDGLVINRVSWTPDSTALIHDGIALTHHYYQYSDLWRFDVAKKKDDRLTHGLRAREPGVSLDGNALAFVQVTPGSTRLNSLRIDGTAESVLYTPPAQTRISHPEFLSAKYIAFSEKREDGLEFLRVLKLKWPTPGGAPVADGEPRTILPEFKPANDVRRTSEGLLFTSSKSGVANLYLASRDLTTARAITNTSTAVQNGEIDPTNGDLFFSRLESYGPQIMRSPKSSWSKADPSPPQVGPLIEAEYPKWTKPEIKVEGKEEDYSIWRYMYPHYWTPSGYVSPYISYFSATTSAGDPLGHHAYSLSATYDTLSKEVSTFAAYTNQVTSVPVTVAGYNLYQFIYSGNGGYISQTTDVNGIANFFLSAENNNWHMGLGWDYSDTNALGYSLRRNGPEVSFLFNNAKQRGLEISPEKGGTVAIDYRRYLPGLSDIEYDASTINLAKYFSGFLPDRHVLAFFLNGSVAPRLNSYLFGTSTIGANYELLPGVRGFVMRGYNSGEFIGKNLLSGTAEYRFPLSYQYHGFKTFPLFLQRWHGDFFVDALTLDGYGYNYSSSNFDKRNLGSFTYGTGFEAKLDATIFYHMPIQFILGLYYGLDPKYDPVGVFPFFGLSL